MKRVFISLITSFFLFSCSQSGLTVVSDPWWQAAYDSEGSLQRTLTIKDLLNFSKSDFIITDNEEEFLSLLDRESNTFIITPVFYSLVKNNDDIEKNNNYIILNGFYDDPADNVIAVYSLRDEVYFQAGIEAAEFSAENEAVNVAAVFYDGSEQRRSEFRKFVEGFESVEGRGELLEYSQGTYSGGERLKKFINSAPSKNVGLFFFSASSLNPLCIELAVPHSIPISGENLNSLGFYNELIEFSVDDDMMEIIETAIQLGLDGGVKDDIPIPPVIRVKGNHF